MQYREYGRTGKKISVIGFGGMRFLPDGDKFDFDKCAAVVRKASGLGVNYFDTSPYYCGSQSEVIFGQAFKDMPKPFYVSTKSYESDPLKLRADLETSLKRMGLQKINFYNIWGIKSMEGYRNVMRKGGPYEEILKAKKEGLVEHVAFSTHCSGEEIAQIAKDGVFEGVTLGYNILNFPFREKGVRAAHAAGMGVMIMNPLSGGILPKKAELFDYIKNPDDKTVTEAALRFLLTHKEITGALCGMGSVEEVVENVKAGDIVKDFPESKREEIKARLSLDMDKLCTGCQYCDGCPAGIEVARNMLAYNYTILERRERYFDVMRMHWGLPADQADKCTECGQCEKKCTQQLDIINRLKNISKWGKERQHK